MLTKLKSLGPGLLYAGAAIGVSHLVQSTKAGAHYGFILIAAILIAHFFKYPFFVVGPRYTNVTGKTLVQGYASIGKWAIYLLAAITFLTMFFVQAAVTIVTAGLAQKITGTDIPIWQMGGIVLIICFLILKVGNFKVFDNLMKVIMVVLAISTVAAFLLSFWVDLPKTSAASTVFSIQNPKDFDALVTLVGWMPAPLDIAIWHSIWTAVNYKNNGKKSLKLENFDFKVGFFGTMILAICFLSLGANLVYGTGMAIETKAGAFANQLIDLFTTSLGPWSYWIMLIAAFTTMFSTTLTCFDAMPSVMDAVVTEIKPIQSKTFWLGVLGTGAIIILAFFVDNMGQMIAAATTISFVTAPILAFLSYILVTKSEFNVQIWNKGEFILAQLGLTFLVLFCIIYLVQLVAIT